MDEKTEKANVREGLSRLLALKPFLTPHKQEEIDNFLREHWGEHIRREGIQSHYGEKMFLAIWEYLQAEIKEGIKIFRESPSFKKMERSDSTVEEIKAWRMGLVGLLLFAVFLFWPLLTGLRTRGNMFAIPFLFLFLNAQKSSSLVDLRLMFAFMSLMVVWRGAREISTPQFHGGMPDNRYISSP